MLTRTVAVLGSLLVSVFLLGACAEQVTGTAQEAASPSPTSTSLTSSPSSPTSSSSLTSQTSPGAAEIDLASLVGTWKGSYFCSQGETGLELEVSPPEGDTVSAVFTFSPVEGGPAAESGSFSMIGRNTPSGFVFQQDEWIDQPGNYVMVDLGIASVSGDTMEGRVAGAGCSDFSLNRG
ncbi:hypothetical protein BAY61_03345 [Prauserella marina]|uniref:Uncharacterized protein n=1 Tax=Prauserella marina TaxID=530584 RepID=A0A222VJV9_9PSEU|nr:hypothetical protein [Prauserella marina]ASR34187.1 hypothetical protein BAY61_03345 [Prauserella marina]PWV70496.1 hypothetical protein DES30_1161 [Prauserella marina]SDE03973.1 hypothetical protein SAMN05421630_11925 [Prauserella marina]